MKIKNVILSLAAAVALVANGGQKVIKNGDTLVFMGDSITQFGKDTVDGYLRLVVQGLAANNINVTWHGVGISGQTAVQMKNRFQNDVVAKNPNVCTIFAGVNDCGSNWPSNTASTPDDVAAMADMAINAGITPVLLSPTGVNGEGFKQNVCDYAAAVKGIATARNIPYAETYEAFRACVDDAANPVINQFGYKATKDGTHMDVVGNRIIAREVLKAFGFDSTEMANAEAAWNANAPFIEFHPSVQITEQEYMAVKAAAGRAGKSLGEYHKDLFYRGAELMKQNPVRVTATSGATVKLSATPLASLVAYDQMIDCGRAMSTHDSVPAIANYAMLAAVHELPAATASDLPTEPVHAVDTSVFSKQVEFTVSGYTGASTLSDFPVAVRIAAGSPSGFSYSDMANSANGGELRFADAAGNSLSYEVEQWNANGASLVWVKMPSLSQGAKFTMYYGGTPADAVESRWTWKADYVGVWHMAEASGTVSDSVNGLDAEPIGAAAATQQVAADGVFGKARVNSANNASYQGQSMLKVSDSTLLDVGSDFTMSAWVKMTALTTVDGLARFASRNRGGGYAPDWELALPNYTTLNGYAGSLTAVSSTVPSAENNWVHIAAVFNGTTLTTYANGVKLSDASITAVQDTDNKLIFGAKDKDVVQGHFTGLFDEFRLRDAVSSADWVKAEYAQSSASFLTASAATAVSGGGSTPDPQPQGDPEGAIAASGDTTGASDLSAIQAAINATANGGTVTLGSGTFYINAQLTVANGVTLAGQGWSKTIIKQVSSGDNMRVATIQGGATVKDVTLTGGNLSTTANYRYGGGVLVNDGTISWCCITNNTLSCGNFAVGGGVCFTGKGQIDHSIVANNRAVSTSEDTNIGGGIGAYQVSGAITIDTCLISGNSAINTTQHRNGKGGGIGAMSMWSTTMTVRNTTIVGNAAGGTGGVNNNSKGGAVYAEGDNGHKLSMVNCIFAGNTTVNGSNLDLAYAGGVDYCLFDDSADKIGTNSKSGDPKFTNAAVGDYTIASDSSAKAAGTTYSGIGKDLSGNDFASNPSMGCYEFGSASASGSGSGSGSDPIVNPPSPHTHTWGAPTYVWSSGNATCTASATCTADSSHTTNKTVNATYAVVQAATETTDGTGRYTATFEAPFTTQTKDVVLPKTGGGSTPDPQPHVDPAGALTPNNDATGAGDFSAIQAAIDTAGNGGTVTLGSGMFYINAQLMVTNGVTLEGQGWERTIIKQVGAAGTTTRVVTIQGGATVKKVALTGGNVTGNYNVGGGAFVQDGTISWCCITNNAVTGSNCKYGGGVCFWEAGGQIDHSIVADNLVQTIAGTDSFGGGIAIRAPYSAVKVDSCLVLGNRVINNSNTGTGGGIYVDSYYQNNAVTIRNTTIVGNTVGDGAGVAKGAAVCSANDSRNKLAMVDCIIAYNTTANSDSDVDLAYADGVDYCLFDNASDKIGTNSKSGDPKFTDAAAGDYTLGADSPAKYAGITYSGIGKDLSGNDFANPPSIGCYEFGSTSGGDPIVDPPAPHTHTWGAPTYVWSSGNATCTASATCTADSSHTTNKTVTAVYTVVVAATATTDGTGRYTATFDPPFSTQTKDIVIPRTGGGSTPDPQPHVDPEGALAPSNDATGANDLSAIQALINAAAPTHGTVTLGSGTFYINTQLMVTNGVTLAGQGWERTVIKQVGSGRVATISGDATVEGVTITGGNMTDQYVHGAGLYVDNGTVSWCCISNNTVSGKGAYGGGVFIKQGAIDHSLIAFNTNDGNGGKGGGIGVNGDYSGPITIDTCLVRGNRAAYAFGASKGAGIGMELKNYGSAVAIRNTTIVENVSGVEGRASEGGALSVGSDYSSKLTMVNCIVAGNTTVGGNPDVKLHHATNVDYCLFDTDDCVTIETSGEQVGSHCKTGDAKFTDAAAGDYTLGADSPAKYAGTTYSGIGKDLMDCDFANPPSMGCYEFGSVPPTPSIALGAASARPLTDYNGSAVEVSFTGSIPDGAVVSAKVTIGGVNYAGSVDAANGVATFAIPSGVVTAGNVYAGTITLTVDGVDYTKGVDLIQGTIKVDESADWVHETASALGSTGAWSGDKATAENGKISVSNATFVATTAAPRAALVTVSSTFEFGSPSETAFETTSRAGVMVVSVGGVNRYAVQTANGAVTNLSVVANTTSPVSVVVTLDDGEHTVSYSIGGVNLGTYAMAEKSVGVSTVRYIGATDVTSLDGAYRFEGLDSNLAKVGGTEYETVADALAAGNGQVELLWDASWNPTVAGDYTITTNGHALVVGGSLAYLVTDNGNGTITVSVSGGSAAETPAAASVTFVGSTVKVGVSDVAANYWYALEKTTDLSKPFVLDETTWTKGSALASGEKELSIARNVNEAQAFYRIVVSTTAP